MELLYMQKYHYTGGGANRTPEEVSKLQKKYELFDKEYLYDIFKNVLDLEITDIKLPMNSSLPHVTYVISTKNNRELFYRGNLGWEEPEIQLYKEKVIADVALRNDLPANKIIYVDISRKKYPFDFQIQEVIEGLDAEVVFEGAKQDYDTYSYDLGVLIGKLKSVKLNGYGHFGDESVLQDVLKGEYETFFDYLNLDLVKQVELIEKSGFISEKVATEILNLFTDAKEIINQSDSSLVHYDLADHNLRYDPNTFKISAIFDWEASVVGDSLLDLASCPTWKTLYPRIEKAKEGFLSIVNEPEFFNEKLDLYRLRTIIWKIEHNLKFGIATPERMQRLALALEPYGLKMK
jgi:aminoglycoside phosphotransferase (APT) family kinase protein